MVHMALVALGSDMDCELIKLVLSLCLLGIGCILTCGLYWLADYGLPIGIRVVASTMVFTAFLAWAMHDYEEYQDFEAEQTMLEFSQGVPEGEYLEGMKHEK